MKSADRVLNEVIQKDPRFPADAYRFLFEALRFTVSKLPKERHVTGQELLDGIRHFALDQFGGMARAVLGHWNIHRTEDIGAMVFNLVNANLMGKTEADTPDDFKNGYDFDKAFPRDYSPGNN
jgi:uncharacterized repeat protein (TIGR04138 family)